MQHLVRLSGTTALVLLILTATLTTFVAATTDRSVVQKTLNAKVDIRREPHGSLRAKVYQGTTLQYEFILDRETPQQQLTQSINRADVYLWSKYSDALVIDDLSAKKRYVLSAFDVTDRLKRLPVMAGKPVFIKGYAVDIIQ